MSLAAKVSIKSTKSPLQVHRTTQSFRSFRKRISPDVSVGFVPTMGALHEGHLSLVQKARANNDIVVASVFVNPTQFGKGEDLDKYPRNLERDSELLNEIGVDHLFAPSNEIMYGKNHVTFVDPTGFDDSTEGKSRPGHFRGVATIVTKLFNIVQPTNAYFGQKDAAQCILIRRIVEDLNMDIDINIVDTMREEDGLAMSSRNAYLTIEERKAASVIYKSLCSAKEVYEASFAGQLPMSADILKEVVKEILVGEPMVSEVQYVSVDCKKTMTPIGEVGTDGAVVSLACKIGSVRLIDNVIL